MADTKKKIVTNDAAHDRHIKAISARTAIKEKSMYTGSKTVTANKQFLHTGQLFKQTTVFISDALVKIIDELLVNCLDIHTNSAEAPPADGGPVTEISLAIDPSGIITVHNNGVGMPIHTTEDGRWSVEMIFMQTHAGSNLDRDEYRITGGTNGLGLKLVTIFSEWITVETTNFMAKKAYSQKFWGGDEGKAEPPTIRPLGPLIKEKSGTTIVLKPNYALLCESPTPWQTADNMQNFIDMMRLRVMQVSAFITSQPYAYINLSKNTAAEPKLKRLNFSAPCVTKFQGRVINCTPQTLAEMYNASTQQTILLDQTNVDAAKIENANAANAALALSTIHYPWHLSVSLVPKGKKVTIINIVNGVMVDKANHPLALLKILCKQIMQLSNYAEPTPSIAIDPKAAKRRSMEALIAMLCCTNMRFIPNPQFGGQTKDTLTTNAKTIARDYLFPSQYVKKVWAMLEARFKELDYEKAFNEQTKHLAAIQPFKYTRAEGDPKTASPADWQKRAILIGEGDAALLTVKQLLNKRSMEKYWATYGLRGVPPNTLKQIREITTGNTSITSGHTPTNSHSTNNKRYLMSKMLENNQPLQGLVPAIGLKFGDRYDTPAALRKLNYHHLILCTDQDVDGIGQIASLVMLFIGTFWPELIASGFVRRLNTPLIRAMAKKTVYEFYNEPDYDQWRLDNPTILHTAQYYKGLAGHSNEEVVHLAATFDKNVIKVILDADADKYCQIMYGCDTNLRKIELRTPIDIKYNPGDVAAQQVKLSEHLRIDAKAFQRDVIARKMPDACDGMLPSGRKALAGARRIPHTKQKVYMLSGYVAHKMMYQHGDSSMNGVIIKLAQTFPGSNNLPKLVPLGMFGDRSWGRGIAGSPRYISTQYNGQLMDLLFPRADDPLLTYVYEEGKRAEPTRYIPILPLAVLETYTSTSVGWKIDIYARSLPAVIAATKLRISTRIENSFLTINNMPIESANAITIDGQEVSMAKIRLNKPTNTLFVTDLPIKMWSAPLRCALLDLNLKNCAKAAKSTTNKDGKKAAKPTKAKMFDQDSDQDDNLSDNDDQDDPDLELNLDDYCANSGYKKLPFSETIEDVFDNTTEGQVNMRIVFKEGAIKQIHNAYADKDDDGHAIRCWGNKHTSLHYLADYCGLYFRMHKNLNLLVDDGSIEEYTQYSQIADFWFERRHRLYRMRLQRQLLLLTLEIEYWLEVLRFIYGTISQTSTPKTDSVFIVDYSTFTTLADKYNQISQINQINIARDFDQPTRVAILQQHKFKTFNEKLLFKPGFTQVEQLRKLIVGTSVQDIQNTQDSRATDDDQPDDESQDIDQDDDQDQESTKKSNDKPSRIDYEYIDRITEYKKSQSGIAKILKRLNALDDKFTKLSQTDPDTLWLSEIAKLEQVIAEGQRTNWMFKHTGYKFVTG